MKRKKDGLLVALYERLARTERKIRARMTPEQRMREKWFLHAAAPSRVTSARRGPFAKLWRTFQKKSLNHVDDISPRRQRLGPSH